MSKKELLADSYDSRDNRTRHGEPELLHRPYNFGLFFVYNVVFLSVEKGGYGQPTVLDLKKGESRPNSGSNSTRAPMPAAPKPAAPKPAAPMPAAPKPAAPIVQTDPPDPHSGPTKMRDVTPQFDRLETPPPPPGPPPQCFFIYNGHDWDAFEVLGVSPYSSFSEITKVYQQQIKKVAPGKHEFLQTAYMAILKKF